MHTIIHVGPHKTGSTAVQSTLWQNRASLLANGILYPESCRYHFAQHRLSFAMKGMPDPDDGKVPDFEREMIKLRSEMEKADPDMLVLSSEEFFTASPASIERLAEEFDVDQTTIVAYVRNPVDVFFSAYNQNTKDPGNKFRMHVAAAAKNALELFPYLNFPQILKRWESVFGKDQIDLIEYESGNAIDQMSDALHLTFKLKTTRSFSNKSVDARAVELIRLSKHAGLSLTDRRKVAELAFAEFLNGGIKHQLSPEELENLAATLCPLYDEIFPEYLGKPNPYISIRDDQHLGEDRPLLTHLDLVRLLAKRL